MVFFIKKILEMDILGAEHSFLDFPMTSESRNLGKANYMPLAIFLKKKLGWMTGNLPYKKKIISGAWVVPGRQAWAFFLSLFYFVFFST